MMNKEAIQQAEAFLKTNRAFYGEEGFNAYGPYGEKAVALMMAEFADQCAPVGEALQKMGIGKLRALLHAFDSEQISMSKFLEEINIHFLGGENYGTEASNTDEAVGATLHSSAGNSVEQGENGDPWISVKDRLPYKDGDSQIFCIVWDTREGIAVLPYNEYHKCWDGEDADDFYTDATEGNITHWMPLPQPPKSK